MPLQFASGDYAERAFNTNMPRNYELKPTRERAALLNITPEKAAEIATHAKALRDVRNAIKAAWHDATGLNSVSLQTLNRLVLFAIERDFHTVYIWLANAAAVCAPKEIDIIKYVSGIRRNVNASEK